MDCKNSVINHEHAIRKESEILIDGDSVKEKFFSYLSDSSQMILENKIESIVKDGASIEDKKNYDYKRIEVYVKEEFDVDLSEYLDVEMETPLKPEENEGDSGIAGDAIQGTLTDFKHFNKDSNDKLILKGRNNKDKTLKCDHCQRNFNQMSNLKAHLRIHTGEKPFKCNHCDKSFNHMTNLKAHFRIHTAEKPFKCEHCHKSFSQMSNLKRHFRIHTGEKPFKCDHCGKSFNLVLNLQRHLRIHTEEKPFKCDHCHKSFSQMSNLKTHLRIHTGEKPFKCDHCGKSFTQSKNLKNHTRIHYRIL